jgi:catechol 2,3-dioxygenase-like lactoylglutathione lyase family enzyme
VSDVGGLLAHIGPGFFQQAFVVADLDAAKSSMRAALGCGAFAELPATDLEYELRGETVTCALALGFARCGDVQVELLQPVRGEGLHVEFLATNGPGAHHLGYLVDDLDESVARAEAAGFPRVMGSRFGSLRFAYVDTFAAMGLFTELVEDPDGMMMSLAPWR